MSFFSCCHITHLSSSVGPLAINLLINIQIVDYNQLTSQQNYIRRKKPKQMDLKPDEEPETFQIKEKRRQKSERCSSASVLRTRLNERHWPLMTPVRRSAAPASSAAGNTRSILPGHPILFTIALLFPQERSACSRPPWRRRRSGQREVQVSRPRSCFALREQLNCSDVGSGFNPD